MIAPARAVALLSGGLDSATLVAMLIHEGYDVFPVAVDYGQRHRKELDAAAIVAHYYDLALQIIDLRPLRPFLGGSALTDDAIPVPLGHYADASMAATVVPNRNGIMLSCAAGYAASIGAETVYTAVHAGDHPVYPDCRPEYIGALSLATQLGTAGVGRASAYGVAIEAPFVHASKADIAALAYELGVPIQHTWSCYAGRALHCGFCGTCVERREALGDADPTEYEMAGVEA